MLEWPCEPTTAVHSQRHRHLMTRTTGMGLCVLVGGVLAALLTTSIAFQRAESVSRDPLFTSVGRAATWDPVVAFSLSRMHSYLSLGVPSDLVRERILSSALAESVGRDGRAMVAHVLDYAHEIIQQPRARQQTRKRFFRTVGALNRMLAEQGLPYYVYASFEWDDEYRAVEEVRFDALAITEVHDYRALDETGHVLTDDYDQPVELRVLHVNRLGPARAHAESLGFTAPDYDETFILPARIAEELEDGLMPMRDPRAPTPLFQVHETIESSAWYQTFRARLADVAKAELGQDDRLARELGWRVLLEAVTVHELQHQIDYQDKLAVRGVFREVAARTEDMRVASAAMHEVSAHLAQLAREEILPRVILAEITSYAFVDTCEDVNCLAALVILDELASEFGHAEPGELIGRTDHDPSIIAQRYVDISGWSSDDVAFAARQAWTRLFGAKLPRLMPIR